MRVRCEQCGKECEKSPGHVTRSRKLGMKLFCGQKCFGLSRRTNKSKQERKEYKMFYDCFFRVFNMSRIKRRKSKYFQKDYEANPEKYRKERERRRKAHLEYCRSPAYKKWKKRYDEKHRAKKKYGDYAEAFILVNKIAALVDNRAAMYEKGIINKKQKREKLWKNLQQST